MFRVVSAGGLAEDLLPAVARTASALLAPAAEVRAARGEGALQMPRGAEIDARSVTRLSGLGEGTVVVVTGRLSTRFVNRTGGWADRRRGTAVVSAHGIDPDTERGVERLGKLVAHEIGHLLGLRHCRVPRCLGGLAATNEQLDERQSFCSRCHLRLTRGRPTESAQARSSTGS